MSSFIAENLRHFKNSIPAEVRLVAISKTKPVSDIREAYEAGQRDFGENRIQEMADKAEELPADIRWHMVGHVQGNKIKYMAPFVSMVHGMDKPKRLKELNKEAGKNERVIDCLLQVHIAEEDSKFGFSYEEAMQTLSANPSEKYPHLRVRGLMGMATFTDDETVVRNEFKGLRSFYNRVKRELNPPDFDTLEYGHEWRFYHCHKRGE
ncbi:MAG: YggS family pyridoxal phosphate-dependent enzyme [Owenweeksia sp.]|nr:YggS family pyridoxal phosphate-dependent enzyme [Owenweeksia sp.]